MTCVMFVLTVLEYLLYSLPTDFVSISSRLVPQNQTVVVVEPPMNYKLVFDGPTNGGLAKPLVNPVSMALFPHVHGASVCAPLYDHYVAEDGLCYHL